MTKSSKKNIYKKFVSNSRINLRYSAVISFIVVVIYALVAMILNNFGSIFSGVFGILLVILFLSCLVGIVQPFIYSYFALNTLENNDQNNSFGMKEFFKGYFVGNKRVISSVLLIPSTLFYSFLIYFLTSLVLSFVIYGSLYLANEDYQNLFNQMISFLQSNNQDGLSNLINANGDLLNTPTFFIYFLSTLFGFYYFIHRFSLNLFKYFLLPYSFGTDKKVLHLVYKETIKANKKYFYSNYYSVLFPLVILILVVFSSSYFLLYYLEISNTSILILDLTSIVITILFLLPFLSILFNFYEVLINKFSIMFNLKMKELLDEQLKILDCEYDSLSNEDKAKVDEIRKYVQLLIIQNNKLKEEKDSKKEENSLDKKEEEENNKKV